MIYKINYDIKSKTLYDSNLITDISDDDFTEIVNKIDTKIILEIPFDEVKLRKSDDVRYSKVYYFPNENVYANNLNVTEFKKLFDFYTLFHPEYITRSGFVFKLNNQWYTFITNCEFVLKFVITENDKKMHIYFNPHEANKQIYKIAVGYKELIPKYFIYINSLQRLIPKMLDYFLFDGIRFLPKEDLPYIVDEKKKLIKVLDGLDFYFFGTSIYDYAMDIDIHINERDLPEAVKRLDQLGYASNKRVKYEGIQYSIPDSKIKIDIIASPYSKYDEPKYGYNAQPHLMYLIQADYTCDTVYSNVTSLFRYLRYNKMLITQKKLGIKFQLKFIDQILSEKRTNVYLDLLNDNKLKIKNGYPQNNNLSNIVIYTDGIWEYLILSMKYENYTSTLVKLSYEIEDMKIVDDVDNIICSFHNQDGKCSIAFDNIDRFAMIKYKKKRT